MYIKSFVFDNKTARFQWLNYRCFTMSIAQFRTSARVRHLAESGRSGREIGGSYF